MLKSFISFSYKKNNRTFKIDIEKNNYKKHFTLLYNLKKKLARIFIVNPLAKLKRKSSYCSSNIHKKKLKNKKYI